MQVTGTIRSVFATEQGGYQSQNGYIYTYDMVIDTAQGPVAGEIGSKAQPYPLAPGQPITAESTQGEYGPRLKKVNPQYAGQPGGKQPNKGRDYDKENRGKCRFGLYQACIQHGCNPAELVADKPLLDAIETLVVWSMTGRQQPTQPPPNTGGRPNPAYSENPPPPPGDDIPF